MAGKSSKRKQKREAPGAVATRVAEMKEGIAQMESFMKEASVLAATEVRRIEEIRGNLEETLARLEAELREKEEMIRQRDSALKELENGLSVRIQDLEGELRERDRLLEGRETEFRESSRTEGTKLAVLEVRLREKEEMLGQKDSAYRALQDGLAAQIRDLEEEVRKRGELLESRVAEILDLQSKMDGLRISAEGGAMFHEGNEVVLEAVERGLGQGSDPDEPLEEESKDFEAAVGLIERSMRDVAVKPGGSGKRDPESDHKQSRLVSLLAPIKRRS